MLMSIELAFSGNEREQKSSISLKQKLTILVLLDIVWVDMVL